MHHKIAQNVDFALSGNDNHARTQFTCELTFEVTMMSALNRLPMEEVSAAAHIVWNDETIADKVALETVQIINQTYKRKFVFFNGKSSKFIVGGLFYLLGFRHDAVKRQRELADKLCTNDVTIRSAYRKWLETFPDLFIDIIGKLALDRDLRCFVLLDLKSNILLQEAKQAC